MEKTMLGIITTASAGLANVLPANLNLTGISAELLVAPLAAVLLLMFGEQMLLVFFLKPLGFISRLFNAKAK